MTLNSNNVTLEVDALIRSVGVNKNFPHALFLGAGASVSSQVPSAADCLWQWKRQIVLTQNPAMHKELYDLSIQSVRDKIQRLLDVERRYPEQNAPEEYGTYIEACYPIAQDRSRYFQSLAEKANASNGYRYLCLLALSGIIKSVWTTNFDGLVNRVASAAQGLTVIEAGIGTNVRALRPIGQNELLVVYLHGDYRYDALKNTSEELREQDAILSAEMIRYLRDVSLIVVGYSGRDTSVMQALTKAYSQPGHGRLYWCGYETPEPEDSIRNLIETARQNQRTAYYVSTAGFDDLALRLALECLEGDLLKRTMEVRSRIAGKADIRPSAFMLEQANRTIAFVKSNAFQIECPGQVYQFEVPSLRRAGAWKALRQLTEGYRICAGLLRDKVLAIGNIEDVKRAFGNSIESEVSLVPIDTKELSFDDGVIASMLTEAIVESLATLRDLRIGRRDRALYLWNSRSHKTIDYGNEKYHVYDGVFVHLRSYGDKVHLVLEATLRATTVSGDLLPKDIDKVVMNQVHSKRYNDKANELIDRWRNLLFGGDSFSWNYPESSSIFRFAVASEPQYARISAPLKGGRQSRQFSLSPYFQGLDLSIGIEYAEPPLIFSNRQADGHVKDPHPMRGTVNNRPYDFRLSESVLGREISLGVICPTIDAVKVSPFLNALKQRIAPRRSNDEYLMEYPGFDLAYGIPLDIPQLHNSAWASIGEPASNVELRQGATELTRFIKSAIDNLVSSSAPSVILIYVPERWAKWEHYELDNESFDLHDVIKAYAIQRGIPTQFLREKTLRYSEQCRIRWWLSLATYVKAGRTPWILEGADDETAYIGIGYTFMPNAPKGKQIVIGCSHIYNASGLGLGYRLSKIDEPQFDRRNNPHLSREDARRIGENTKQLFHRSGMPVPKRVVIHKRTHFREDEIKGLLEGLSGIPTVDMLELTEASALKYFNGKNVDGRIFYPDKFAIRRGTCIPLDGNKALLWVHGVTDALQPGYRFFLGGRGTPTPIVITRHFGSSTLALLANQILGLSKMNWNNFDMYSPIPATIDTSNTIARIGVLLGRFGAPQYDYRLFI